MRWRVSGQRNAVRLTLKPLLPCREADALTVENVAFDARVERDAGGITCTPYRELAPLSFTLSAPHEFVPDPAASSSYTQETL